VFTPIHAQTYAHTQRPTPISNRTTQIQPPKLGITETPTREPQEQGETHTQQTNRQGYSRDITNLAKAYVDEDRYSGHPDDSFEYKFSIFLDNCERVGIPPEAQNLAFPIMLTNLAKDYYYKSCRNHLTLDQLHEAMQRRFETDEQGRLNLLKWESLTLESVIKKNPDKNTSECLDILIKTMTTIQRNLPSAYHDDKILCDKLINACRTTEACKFACYKAGNTLVGIISDLQASITTHEQTKHPNTIFTFDKNPEPDAYFVDRRYKGPSRPPRSSQKKYHQPRDQSKKCLVCKKYGCWSTNHTPTERQQAAAQMKRRYEQVNRGYNQFMAELEDDEQDDEFDEAFEALIVDTDNRQDQNDRQDQPNPLDISIPTIYLTSCGKIDERQVHEMLNKLADRSVEHAITRSTDTPYFNTTTADR
jgi:hypothetical protein